MFKFKSRFLFEVASLAMTAEILILLAVLGGVMQHTAAYDTLLAPASAAEQVSSTLTLVPQEAARERLLRAPEGIYGHDTAHGIAPFAPLWTTRGKRPGYLSMEDLDKVTSGGLASGGRRNLWLPYFGKASKAL